MKKNAWDLTLNSKIWYVENNSIEIKFFEIESIQLIKMNTLIEITSKFTVKNQIIIRFETNVLSNTCHSIYIDNISYFINKEDAINEMKSNLESKILKCNEELNSLKIKLKDYESETN